MPEKRKFALIVWEQTEEFKKFLDEAEQKRKKLVRVWEEKYGGDSYVGPVEPNMSEEGEPVFWINDLGSFHTGRFYEKKRKWSAQEALRNSLKYGNCGWWTLSDLEQLIEGRGPLLESAMRDCGFRPHKRNPNRWVRIDEGQEKKEWGKNKEELKKKYKEEEEKGWSTVFGEELERLNQMWVLANEWAGLNKTYSIEVNKKGLIYVCLEVSPFSARRTEDLGWFGEMLRNRGHIARQQNGFYIEAKNIKLGQEKGIYIKAIRPDNSYIECVWPHHTPQPKIYDLADDLVLRVNRVLTPR